MLAACSQPKAFTEQLSVGGTTLGNPLTQLSTNPFTTTSANFAYRICLDEIVFFKTDGTPISEPINGLFVNLDPTGTILPPVNPPPGDYDRVELRIADTCGGPTTLSNANGSYSTTDVFAMHFTGNRTVVGDHSPWVLDFQPIVDALETVSRDSKIAIEGSGISGSF